MLLSDFFHFLTKTLTLNSYSHHTSTIFLGVSWPTFCFKSKTKKLDKISREKYLFDVTKTTRYEK